MTTVKKHEAGEEDRRVRKTRRQLREALIALMLERGWDAVSVRDICQRADVGRSTFYVHFADKENLLLSGFDELHRGMEQLRTAAPQSFGFLLPLAEHAAENRRLVEALLGRQSGQRVHWRFKDMLRLLIEAELGALGVPPSAVVPGAHYIAGGTAELLMGWVEHPKGVSAEQITQVLRRHALAVTRSLKKP
jgi:AcrR family transcriptional regulator